MSLSARLESLEASPTLALNAKVKELQSEGKTIYNFAAGEPDFNTPENIMDAAARAMKAGYTKYTAANGAPELRKAISDKLKKENGLSYDSSEIIVSNGGKHSLFNALSAICNPGDSVIIPSPYWVSYKEMVKLTGASPVTVKTEKEDDFKLTAEHLLEIAGPKTKVLILNSPNNPTGSVYSRNELRDLSRVAIEKGIYVLSDEIYEHLVYAEEHASIASMRNMKDLAIVINGASKAYAMTGWRIGFAAGPSDIIKVMSTFQSQTTSNPNSIAQMAYLEALTGSQAELAKMRDTFRSRRNMIVDLLNSIPGIDCPKPHGAFYAFPDVTGVRDFTTSDNLSMELLTRAGVSVVPGSAFGVDSNVRMSYACSEETIENGIEAMREYLS